MIVKPLSGVGLVARAGDLVLTCADSPAAGELLALVAEVADAGGDGSMLVRRLAALLAADFAGRLPACAASGPAPDGRVAVLVHGDAVATITGAEGSITLTAVDAVTSVNRLVAGPVLGVRLELPGAGAPHRLVHLDAGVVVGGGVAWGEAAAGVVPAARRAPESTTVAPHQAPVPAASPASEPTPSEPAVSEPAVSEPAVSESALSEPTLSEPAVSEPSLSGLGGGGPTGPDATWPQPTLVTARPASTSPLVAPRRVTAGRAPRLRDPDPSVPFVALLLLPGEGTVAVEPASPPEPDGRPQVLGLACVAAGHLNPPGSAACAICGAPLFSTERLGPRPPLGVLLLDDGSAFRLDSDYLLGREPHQDPEVQAGRVRPLKIADPEGVVSRRHLRVSLVGWEVRATDLSANGTLAWLPGEPASRSLAPRVPTLVPPGSRVILGPRWLTVEADRAPVAVGDRAVDA